MTLDDLNDSETISERWIYKIYIKTTVSIEHK